MARQPKHFYDFGPFSLDPAERVLRREGKPVTLTPKAFDLLLALVRDCGRVLDKEELIKTVWPDSFVEEGNLSVTVFMLRKALGEGSGEHTYIETVPRRGYRFVAAVTEHRDEAGPTGRDDAAVKSIAVLPFRPLSADGSDAYLGLGVADALITKLGNLSRILVRPTSAVLKFAGAEQDPVTIGRDLGVESVLEGTIRRAGERIRVTVQLVSLKDTRQLWAEIFDEQFTDIFAVEDSISEKVAAALTLRLTGEERKRLTKHYTENTEAYHLCLKGRYFFSKETEEGVRKGIEYLHQAIEMDPAYGLAYAWIADCYCWLSHFYLPPREAMPRARHAALKALEIDETLAEAHTSLALVRMWYEWDFTRAEVEFKRAIEINTNYAVARLWYAFFLTATRRHDEAIREIELAHKLDPLSLFINSGVGFPFYYARRYERAREQAHKLIEMEPDFWTGHWLLGCVSVETGQFDEAVAEFQKAITLSGGGAEMIAALGHAYAAASRRDEAERVLTELNCLSGQRYVSPYHVATIYAGLGEKDPAFACLERAYLDRSEWLIWLQVDPKLSPLRSDSRFEDLLRRVGFN